MRDFVIGCDSAATMLKDALKVTLESLGCHVEDVGCYSKDDPEYYPYVAKRVCDRIIASNYEKRGVIVCGTGLGVCIAANKCPGIRAGVCHDSFSAERLALSNDGNVICFGERVIGVELARKILKEWASLEFKDGPSTAKVKAITAVERDTMK